MNAVTEGKWLTREATLLTYSEATTDLEFQPDGLLGELSDPERISRAQGGAILPDSNNSFVLIESIRSRGKSRLTVSPRRTKMLLRARAKITYVTRAEDFRVVRGSDMNKNASKSVS